MSKLLMESLKMDLPALAEMLRSKGRGKDTVLAHITPKEAALLKKRGGRGSTNPDTGLLEFDDGEGFDAYAGGTQDQISAQNAANQQPSQPVSPNYDAIQAPAENVTNISQPTDTSGGNSGSGFNVNLANTGFGINPQTTPSFGSQLAQRGTPTGLYDVGQGTLQPGLTSGAGQDALRQSQTEGPAAPSTKAGFGDKALAALTDPSNLAKLGLVGGLGLFGANQAKKGANQVQTATQEQKAIGQPYTQQGQQLVNQAQAGQLTPQSQQALNAAAAQLNQGIANRGGVGQQQAAQQLAVTYQSLLDNQYKYGLQIMQIGDNYATGAIKTGLQLDQQLQNTTNSFYTNLASILGGGNFQVPSAQRTA
jgi:hypothetical protein